MSYSPWQEAIDRYGLTEGPTVKFTNERWTTNDLPTPIGADGVRLCMLMTTATWGAKKWENAVNTESAIFSFEDSSPSNERLGDDWQLHTACQVVGMDEKHNGVLMAFVSTAVGGRTAFMSLIPGYRRKDEKEFPIVILGSKLKKGEKRDYVNPTFEIVGWAPRDDFKDYLPPPRPPKEAPAQLPAPPMHVEPEPEPDKALAPIDDDIPF